MISRKNLQHIEYSIDIIIKNIIITAPDAQISFFKYLIVRWDRPGCESELIWLESRKWQVNERSNQ